MLMSARWYWGSRHAGVNCIPVLTSRCQGWTERPMHPLLCHRQASFPIALAC